MKNISSKIFVVLILSLIISCSNVENNSDANENLLANANWLTGTWQNISNGMTVTETWKRADDTSMEGKSFVIEAGDTVSSETIYLKQRKNNVFYIAEVSTQNEGKPVSFKLTSSSNDSLVFVNPKHDFPQKISYRKISDDSLVAEISGMLDRKYASEKFPMGRVR